jgi:hypothetical protein
LSIIEANLNVAHKFPRLSQRIGLAQGIFKGMGGGVELSVFDVVVR